MSVLEIFPWNDNLETGIALIDEQHKKLVDLLNLLVRQIATQADAMELDAVFSELKDYVQYHFSCEEEIWKDYFEGDTWQKWHIQTHADFIAEVHKIESHVSDQAKDETLLEIVRTLTHWLARHILDSDKRMAKVVLALPTGVSLSRAKEAANEEMAGSTKLLIDTIMAMYDRLANNTVEMSREIHKRKLVEAELQRSKLAVETASKAKTAFLAHMSHELRTPLNTILGYSDLLRHDATLSAAHRNALSVVHRSGEHLLEVIQDVLELTKIEAGHVQLNLRAFSLSATVHDVVEMLALPAREKQILLATDLAADFPASVVSDEFKIRQILINLISNAIHATHDGSVTVRLRHGQGDLELSVLDTGIGISEFDQTRIFLPFEQARSESTHGTGLGLAICQQFVQHLGGTIQLESAPGSGSTFTVRLALVQAPHGNAPEPLDRDGEIFAFTPQATAVRVLVVDDDHDSRTLLTEVLQRVGFSVRCASDGQQAIDSYLQHGAEFIWMDQEMPGVNGLQAAQAIRGSPGGESTKIVLLTAASLEVPDPQALPSIIDAVVFKPLRVPHIYGHMERLLELQLVRTNMATPGATALDPGAWNGLPSPLRQRLATALALLDQQAVLQVISDIAVCDPVLSKALLALAGNYQYDAITGMLAESAPVPDPGGPT
jgi:hemerythrin-like metal-binding protein